MKKVVLFVSLICIFCFLTACTPGPNPNKDTSNSEGNVAGFWIGTWHGMIEGIAFIGTWFSDDINIYEVYNNGVPYHFGLYLGRFIVFIFFSGISVGIKNSMQS